MLDPAGYCFDLRVIVLFKIFRVRGHRESVAGFSQVRVRTTNPYPAVASWLADRLAEGGPTDLINQSIIQCATARKSSATRASPREEPSAGRGKTDLRALEGDGGHPGRRARAKVRRYAKRATEPSDSACITNKHPRVCDIRNTRQSNPETTS